MTLTPTWTDPKAPPPVRRTGSPPPLPGTQQAPSSGPLSDEHLEQLACAKLRAKKVRKACTVATVNASLLVVFSGCSLLMVLLGMMFGEFDIIGLGMGAALGFLAWNEFRGRAMLKRFEMNACRVLGWNQLSLLAMVTVYSAWMIGTALWGPSPYDQAIAGDNMLAGPLGSINDLYKMISVAIYGGLIVGTLIFQGLNALYYFSRRKHVEAYVNETPEWVVELQRQGVAQSV